MNTSYNLIPSRQKSYYGKAKVIEDGGAYSLQSYETIVCRFDANGGFVRLWGGWSATTAKHVNDFRRLFGLDPLSKKEWESLPVENGSGERYKVEFSNGFVSWTAGTIFDSYDDADSFGESIAEARGWRVCYAVCEI